MDIIEKFLINNRCYKNNIKKNKKKLMLHSTGTPGANALNFFNNWNKSSANVSVEFCIDDTGIYQFLPIGIQSWHAGKSIGNNEYIACEICEPLDNILIPTNWQELSRGNKSNKTFAVTLLQKELSARNYDPNGIDGSFGPGCEEAVKKFQKDNNLNVDGVVGKKTLLKLQDRNNSFLKYQQTEYFKKVYSNAVDLFAYLCKEIGGSPKDIICHSEGYKLGIASNHADVMHWFLLENKTMDDFRKDVENKLNNISTLFEDNINLLVKNKIINIPEIWKDKKYSFDDIKLLINNMAKYIGGDL